MMRSIILRMRPDDLPIFVIRGTACGGFLMTSRPKGGGDTLRRVKHER